MDAKIFRINYKSDFVLTINSDAGWAVPFCIKFWTGMPSHGYFAGFDGENYVNCRVGETPTQLLVMFDDHHMQIGPLRMQIAYHTTIKEFPDRKFDEVTNPTNVTVDIDGTEYQVMLDFTGETGAEIDFSMPSSGVMSVNGKIGYVTLNAEDVGAQPTIEDLATIRSGAAEGATAVQPAEMTAALATKQDTIPDLATIRSGAAAGSTAVQPAALQEALAGKQDTIADLSTIRSGAAAGATAVQPAGLQEGLATKQDTIADLSTIRSGAAAGATAVQPAAITPIQTALQTIEAVIPSAASSQNQLADKNFVNSSIATNTANFVGTYNSLAELQAVQNPTNNDYGFVIETDAQGNEYYDRYKYVAASQQWLFEYKVESTPFTAAQWAAIQSGITSALVTKLNALPTNAELQQTLDGKANTSDIPTALSQLSQDSTHRVVTDAEKSTWNGKQNAIDDLATIRSGAAAGATAVQPDAMNTALAAKQDTLTFDNTPTANSNNPVKSSGIKTALDAKQNAISTVNVTVDNNTGTPSGSASVSGSTLSLSFQNLKGATGATGATGPQGPQGERGLPGESGVTGDVSSFTVIQTIDPSATYGATDIAGAATVQATNAELTELAGEVAYGSKLSTSYGADGMTSGVILRVAGNTSSNASYMTSDYIELPSDVLYLKTSDLASNNSGIYIGLVLYNSSQTKLTTVCGNGQPIPEIIDIKNDYPTAKYIRYCSLKSVSPVVEFYVPGTLKEAMDELSSEISGLNDELQYGSKLSTSYGSDGMTSGTVLKVAGGTSSISGYMTSDYIELPANTTSLHTSGLIPNNANTYIGLVLYNSSQSKLATICESGQSIPEIIDVKNDYPSAKYIRYCSYTSSSPVVDIYVVGTLKDAVDELSGVKPLGNLINITESSYGNNYTIGSTYANQPLWFTHQNVASEVDGILKSVWFYAPNIGTYEFAVGLLDQRNTLVNERYFSLTFETTGVHNVDVYDKEIKINKGEQVFAHFISTLKATLYNSAQTYTSLYASSATSEFTRSWTNGAISGLGWTILSIEAPFALKSDVAQLEDKINSLEQQAGNIGYVVSQNGEKYRMSVSNGEIVLLSTQYKKVIALGNSLTNHGAKESIGWYGGAWAMAATRENTGWTQQFQRILRQKESNATVTGVNVYSWERNPTTANLSDMLDSYLTNDVDCIIFRAGENAHPSDSNTWSEQIKTLLNYCLTRCPNASIILSTCMWADATKDAAIAKVATDWGLPLIYPGTSSNKERMGDYVEGTDLQLHKITDSGVAKHVNDIGFLRFANRLAANIGYATLDEQHDVTVVDGGSIGYTCFSSWVANGIFNIKTTATTVTAEDANNNALTVTNHGDEFFTFVMPDTDVTITIS